MGRFNLAIVIPAYNEEKTIGKIIKLVDNYGKIIVINDGSTDSTYAIASNLGAEIVNHETNRGYDSALISGFNFSLKSDFDYMVTIDADGQHKPGDIEKYLNDLNKGKECVVGVRDKKQRISEYLFSIYTKLFWKIDDPLCGMKAYNLNAFKKLKNSKIEKLIGTQFLMFALRNNFNIGQINIKQNKRIDIPRFGSSLSSDFLIMGALIKVIYGDIYSLFISFKDKLK